MCLVVRPRDTRSCLREKETRVLIGILGTSFFVCAVVPKREDGDARRVVCTGRKLSGSTRYVVFKPKTVPKIITYVYSCFALLSLSTPTPPRLFFLFCVCVDQALLGFTRNLTHLDGRVVSLVRKGVTQPGFVQTIKGEGMPFFERPTSYGDLFVEYNVVLPTKLSKETRQGASCHCLDYRPSDILIFLTQLSQVSPKRFMGNHIEIKTNYRLIYCIPHHCILGYCGVLVHKSCTRVSTGTGLLSALV